MRRLVSSLAALAALALVATVTPWVGPGPVAAQSARQFGATPLDDVLHWAAEERRCGLTTNKLAALVLAPTYPETGAPPDQSPSPMTLSRWDDQPGLHSFGTRRGQPRAFWHPGIGPWQFDSAGLGAPFTAAQRIDTWVMAAQAAATMAARWCTNPTLAYVWAPWYGCGGSTCRTIYEAIYRPRTDRLVGVGEQATVGRRGGMTRHTCTGPGRAGSFPCWRVDPARAQGYRAFTAPGYGPAPITAPFYVYGANGREYRHWLRRDTGYQQGIWATRPLGANARTGLVWHRGEELTVVTPTTGSGRTYQDVGPRAAYASALAWATRTGMVAPDGRGRFRPAVTLRRADAAAWVWAISGRPTVTGVVAPSDVTAAAPERAAILWAVQQGVVRVFPDGAFRPDGPVTRAALVSMLWRAAGRPAATVPLPFSDVGPASRHAPALTWAAARGYLPGVDGSTFSPADAARRSVALRWVHAARPFDDVAVDAPVAAGAAWARHRGVVDEVAGVADNTLRAEQVVTRIDAARMLWATAGRPAPAGERLATDLGGPAPAVDWVLGSGILRRTAAGAFRPAAGLNRAQAALALWLLAGRPAPTTTVTFSDLAGAVVSTKAVTWAHQQGILVGVPGGAYRPVARMTRGDLIGALHRLASVPSAWADPAGAPDTVTFPR